MVKQKSSSVHTAHHAQRAGRVARFFLFRIFLQLEKMFGNGEDRRRAQLLEWSWHKVLVRELAGGLTNLYFFLNVATDATK